MHMGNPPHRDSLPLHSPFYDLPSLPPGEPITHVHMHETLRLDPPQGEDQLYDFDI